MNKISFIRSLVEFNKRVLYAGNMHSNRKYNIEEINNKIFYNKIFLSNTKEMFEKYDMNPIIDDYIELLDK